MALSNASSCLVGPLSFSNMYAYWIADPGAASEYGDGMASSCAEDRAAAAADDGGLNETRSTAGHSGVGQGQHAGGRAVDIVDDWGLFINRVSVSVYVGECDTQALGRERLRDSSRNEQY